MAEYLIQGETLTNIANAIRGKTGDTATMKPNEMAALIESFEVGGGLPDGVSALASGTFTLTSDDSCAVNVTHNLGVVPNFGACIIEEAAVNMEKPALIGIASFIKNIYGLKQIYVFYGGDGYNQQLSAAIENGSPASDTEYLFTNNDIPFGAGYTYRWVCGVMDGIQ